MASYLGNLPSNNFVSLKRQVITGNGGSTYTLDHSVASVNDVAIFVNNVRQDPASYSISTTSLTLGGTISSSDSCYVLFLGQALQTVTPDANTITNAMLGETITVANGGTGLTSGFANGITMADQWRLSADTNTSTNADITTNWERVDNTGWGGIGTGMTESSGIFSFPSTGIYLINFQMRFVVAGGDGACEVNLNTTTDNSSYTKVARAEAGNTSGSAAGGSGSQSILFDVTNTSTHKVKFSTDLFATSTRVSGNTDNTRSGVTFVRLGDT